MRSPLARIATVRGGSAGVPEIAVLTARAFDLHTVADQRAHPAEIGQHSIDIDSKRTIARDLHCAAGVDVRIDHGVEPAQRFAAHIRGTGHAIVQHAQREAEIADADRVQRVDPAVDVPPVRSTMMTPVSVVASSNSQRPRNVSGRGAAARSHHSARSACYARRALAV